MRVRIVVTLKPGVLDPQGKAIHKSLANLGFSGVSDVRTGKVIELDLADDTNDAQIDARVDAQIDAMCRQLIANTVIENYRIERL